MAKELLNALEQFHFIQIYSFLLLENIWNVLPFYILGRDFICVQSMDGMLTFFEQETYSSKISLPNFLLPGPIVYLSTTDSFVTVSCVRQVEVYKLVILIESN